MNYGKKCHANCFEFNHILVRNCSGQSNCEHEVQCLQDSRTCPKTSVCSCLSCSHEIQCQFNSERFDLSFDAILGYHIEPHIIGLVNGILSVITYYITMHDPFHRHLIDDDDENRIWCIISYSHSFQIYNLIINIFHFFVPFLINLISAIIISITTVRQRKIIQNHQSYKKKILYEKFKQHKHLLLTSITLVILAILRLIISLVSGCMKSSCDSWLFLAGYFISFIQYRQIIRTRLRLAS
ncbi:unnamed protein product [Rotaria sp. Silwood1]|nr:unnamed protein product [Rotaria sp. Silwood1]CAF1606812.1 unnamed protein product [Rotaria sp. Silwood1]CAF3735691.1 unnamed protein product [Rotaria sp. Silwood1]CAF4868911.1 unnamed protein product [Rotaria sp. Silwood1]CAF4884151.1 unnamed protein product [Rotaria sp. Silwood1]